MTTSICTYLQLTTSGYPPIGAVSSPTTQETKEREEEERGTIHTRGEHHPRPHTSTEWHDFPQHNGHNRSKGTRQGQDQPHPPQLSA